MLKILKASSRLLSTKPVPPPSAEVPDVNTFLTKIGRNMSQYSEHFETWESLMTAQSRILKNKGVENRDRKYILGWIERYRQNLPLEELKRGKKKWGGERNRRANRAAFYGRKAAEERENQ